MPQTDTINGAYKAILQVANNARVRGNTEVNERTGIKIASLDGGISFKLSLTNERLPVPGNRRYCIRLAAAEAAWQLTGTKDPAWILEKAPNLWGKFVEDDGLIQAAYGYRWRRHFERDQVAMALDALKKDPTNRQVYISTWDPRCDGLGAPNQPKNIPCVVGFSLARGENHTLNMSVFMRSSDIFVGLPYDMMCYALTLDAFAASLNLRPNRLHFTLAHAHVYEPHFTLLPPSLSRAWYEDVSPVLPAWTVEAISADPEGYLAHVRRLTGRVNKCEYDPKPEVVA